MEFSRFSTLLQLEAFAVSESKHHLKDAENRSHGLL
jgi:hypothetical protein